MNFIERWRTQIEESLEEFAALAAQVHDVDFKLGIISAGLIWPVREHLQTNEQFALEAVREIIQAEPQILFEVVDSWSDNQLKAVHSLIEAAAYDEQLKKALLSLIEYFDAYDIFSQSLIQQVPSYSNVRVDEIKAGLVAIDSTVTIHTLNLYLASKKENPPPPFMYPKPVDGFVGREELISLVASKFEISNSPLSLGLHGPGGIGKTSIAIQAVHRLRKNFPEGILWADLDSSTPQSMLARFAESLNLSQEIARESKTEDRAIALWGKIANRKLLVVLNNAEKMDAIESLQLSYFRNSLLLTSRDQNLLDMAGAVAIDIPPLTQDEGLEYLNNSLGDKYTLEDEGEAEKLLKYVGGFPLALTLVAGALRNIRSIMTLEEYLAGLTSMEERLDEWQRDKNRNLLATFEFSYDNLTDSLQKIFISLALMQSPDFTSEAIAAMHDLPVRTIKLEFGRLLSLALIMQGMGERDSILNLSEQSTERFRLHPLIKDFALAKLAQGEATTWRERLSTYYATLIEGSVDSEDYSLFDLEWENISEALEDLYHRKKWPLIINCALKLSQNELGSMGYLDIRGHWSEARQILAWASAGANHIRSDPLTLVRIMTNLGGFAVRQTDFEEARSYLNQSLEIINELEETTDTQLQRLYIYDLMSRSLIQSDPATALDWLERGIAESEKKEHKAIKHQTGYLHTQLAAMYMRLGDTRRGIDAAELALTLLPKGGSAARVAGLLNLGIGYESTGQVTKSMETFSQGLLMAQEVGDTPRLAALWASIGRGALKQGRPKEAIDYQERAMALFKQIGDVYNESGVTLEAGYYYLRIDDIAKAKEYLTGAIALSKKHNFSDVEAIAKGRLTEVYFRENAYEAAESLISEAHNIGSQLQMGFFLSTTLRLRAEIALAMGNITKSLGLIDEAIKIAHENEDIEEEGVCWRVKGSIYSSLEDHVQAQAAFEQSLMALTVSDPYEMAKTKLVMAKIAITSIFELASSTQTLEWLQEAIRIFETVNAVREKAETAQIISSLAQSSIGF